MRCSELIDRLYRRGVMVELDDSGENLRVINFSRVLPDEKAALSRDKGAVIKYLKSRVNPVEPATPGNYWLCLQRNRWISSADEPMPYRFMGISVHIPEGYHEK